MPELAGTAVLLVTELQSRGAGPSAAGVGAEGVGAPQDLRSHFALEAPGAAQRPGLQSEARKAAASRPFSPDGVQPQRWITGVFSTRGASVGLLGRV